MLDHFYAVTVSGSLYCIRRGRSQPYPLVFKVTGCGLSSVAPGESLARCPNVGINERVVTYFPEHQVDDEGNLPNWVGQTSLVVGLFRDADTARRCAAGYPGLQQADQRWINETRKVLGAIGDNDPDFEVFKDENGEPLLFNVVEETK